MLYELIGSGRMCRYDRLSRNASSHMTSQYDKVIDGVVKRARVMIINCTAHVDILSLTGSRLLIRQVLEDGVMEGLTVPVIVISCCHGSAAIKRGLTFLAPQTSPCRRMRRTSR